MSLLSVLVLPDGAALVSLAERTGAIEVPLVGAVPAGHMGGVCTPRVVAVGTTQQAEQALTHLDGRFAEGRLVELSEGGLGTGCLGGRAEAVLGRSGGGVWEGGPHVDKGVFSQNII